MTCPRCGTITDHLPCPECGFPEIMRGKENRMERKVWISKSYPPEMNLKGKVIICHK